MSKALSKAQSRMLADVQRDGVRYYNGRARRTIEILAAEGLVTYEFDLVSHSKGNGLDFTERYAVRPAKAVKS